MRPTTLPQALQEIDSLQHHAAALADILKLTQEALQELSTRLTDITTKYTDSETKLALTRAQLAVAEAERDTWRAKAGQ